MLHITNDNVMKNMGNRTENHNRIFVIIWYTKKINIIGAFVKKIRRSLSKRYLIKQLLCHPCYTDFTQVARNCVLIVLLGKISVKMHMYTVCPYELKSFMKFCWAVKRICADTLVYSIGQISKFKRGITPRKNLNQNFLRYAHLHVQIVFFPS